jgi:hypothetical protein
MAHLAYLPIAGDGGSESGTKIAVGSGETKGKHEV